MFHNTEFIFIIALLFDFRNIGILLGHEDATDIN